MQYIMFQTTFSMILFRKSAFYYLFNLPALFILFSLYTSPVLAQKDTEFWFAAPDLSVGHTDNQMNIIIAAYEEEAIVTIKQPAGTLNLSFSIAAHQAKSISLNSYKDLIECIADKTEKKGIQLVSTSPISAYYEMATEQNPDIFSFKGNNALGTDFIIPSQNDLPNGTNYTPAPKSGCVLVATENNTQITITPTCDLVGNHPKKTPFTITLQKGETYAAVGLANTDHLTGTTITSTKKIAITIADDSVMKTANNETNYDLIGDQIVPTDALGREYIAIEGESTNEIVYLTATKDGTNITVNGSTQTINKGETIKIAVKGLGGVYISATEKIYAFQTTGYKNEIGGALLPSLVCRGSKEVSFVRPTSNDFWLMVIAKTVDKNNFTLSHPYKQVQFDNNAWKPLNSEYSYYKKQYSNGTCDWCIPVLEQTTISNTSGSFHVGFISTGNDQKWGAGVGFFSDYGSTLDISDQKVTTCKFKDTILTATSGHPSYLWNTGETTPAISITNPTTSTTYSVTIINATGCSDKMEVELLIANQTKPTFIGDSLLCLGESASIMVNTPGTYLWNSGFTGNPILINTPLTNTTYTVTVFDQNGCTNSNQVTIDINPIPSALLSNPGMVCPNTQTAITAYGGTTYIWQDISEKTATRLITPSQPTTYSVTVIDENGCSNTTQTIINTYPTPYVSAGENQLICYGKKATLTANTASYYLWSEGFSNTPSIEVSPTQTTTYSLTITDANGCTNSNQVEVEVTPPMTAPQVPDRTICLSDTSTNLLILPIKEISYTYQWSIGTTNLLIHQGDSCPIVGISTDTTFYVQAISSEGCVSDKKTIAIHIGEEPSSAFIIEKDDIYIEEEAHFTAISTNNNGDFWWDLGENEGFINHYAISNTYAQPGTYYPSLTTFSKDGCRHTQIEKIIVRARESVFVPSMFTPNEDGFNDKLYARSNVPLFSFHWRIYNQWGILIYESFTAMDGWDGTYKGQPQPIGNYVYSLQCSIQNNYPIQQQGVISIGR